MTKSDIKKLNDGITAILTAAEKTLEVVPILFDSRARDEEEKNLYTTIAQNLPDLREDIAFLSALTFADSLDSKFDLSVMIDIVRELSDRYVALKVLVKDLVPLLTSRAFDHSEVAAYFPYLSVLLNQIKRDADDLGTWYEEHFYSLREWFEYDLKEDRNFQIIRSFVDRCLTVYLDKHSDDKHIAIVRAFRDFALESLDRYADGDNEVSFTFSFCSPETGRNPGDVEKVWIEIRVDGSIDVSMSEYVIGLCGGDSELLWSYSLWGGGNSVGVNELKEHSAEEIGSWRLSVEYPDEFYYDEESEESGNEEY